MKILILDNQQIRELLPMTECIELMADALAALAREEVYQPLRTIVRPPEARGLLGLMPAYRAGEQGAFGLKAICVFPENPANGKDAHQGAVMLFSRETGELLALMNASEITAIRPAAVSAVATRLLAREDAQQLGIIGARVNAIGTHSPNSREIDSATMAAARIFVDRRESALNESGDYLLAAKEGLVNAESIVGEIGELLIGTKTGRTSPN